MDMLMVSKIFLKIFQITEDIFLQTSTSVLNNLSLRLFPNVSIHTLIMYVIINVRVNTYINIMFISTSNNINIVSVKQAYNAIIVPSVKAMPRDTYLNLLKK